MLALAPLVVVCGEFSAARTEQIGEDAVLATSAKGDKSLVFPEGCQVFALGRAKPVRGRFGAGGIEAVALRTAGCGQAGCPVAVLVQGKGGTPLLAARLADCDEKAELRPLKLFDDRDSLELLCRASAGAGWIEHHLLLDAQNDTLVTLADVHTGSYEPPSPEERKAGRTASCPVGWLKVEKVADQPLVRVLDPDWGALVDGRGTAPARQLGYDGKKHELVPTGAPDVATPVDAHAACRTR